ncbi:MAG: class I SAM-dependent methyltransferase [archaeon]
MKKSMRKLVEEGYDKGDYSGAFRATEKMGKLEKIYLSRLIKLVKKGSSILDFGCGTGIPFDKYLTKKGFKVTGVDISKKHLSLARKNVPKARFIKSDFSKVKFKEKFEAIISFYAIFHIPRAEHRSLFRKMYRLLEKDGIILVNLGASGEKYSEEKDWVGAKMAWSQYKPKVYKKILVDLGFKIIKADFEGKPGDAEYHFWILASK